MAIRRIRFPRPMVQALLEGRKTQTRLVIKDAPTGPGWYCDRVGPTGWQWTGEYGSPRIAFRPKYAVGDLLWVRETCAWPAAWDDGKTELARIWYPAGTIGRGRIYDETKPDGYGKTRPSICMPRWASRLTLRVTDVRVERVREISEADAIAEGCPGFVSPDGEDGLSPQEAFADLWNSLYAKRGLGSAGNPWVAAYTFEVIPRNVDEVVG